MPLKTLTTEEANAIGKTPFEEVIRFIVSECEDGANNLPATYVGQPNNETGRITKGFAMAVKSKALLYAASKQHNPSNNQEKWEASAKAARSEEHTSELQSPILISYAVFCLKKKKTTRASCSTSIT